MNGFSVVSFSEFLSFFEYDFVWFALVVGVLIALSSSLLGVTLVLKRFSFIGDGLSHVAFGAMAVAAVAGLTNELLIALPVTAIAAVILLKTGNGKAKIMGDASLALLSVSALAIGYLLYGFSGTGNLTGDVCATLFGSTKILTLNLVDVCVCVGLSVFVIGFFVLFYNKIFAVTFDEGFARATGVKTGAYEMTLAIVIALVIVLSMVLVGSLLISALVVFPALSCMRIFGSFKKVVIFSAIESTVTTVLGILFSMFFSTPVGSTVVLVELLAFLCFSLVGALMKRKKAH